jgi:hypothetical protein
MGKIINSGIWPAADLKAEADIPDQSSITIVNTTTLDCSNIRDTDVKNVLGESTTGVFALCSSINVNRWARFKPGYLGYNIALPTLPDVNPTIDFVQIDGRLGMFAGYNHQEATKPTYWESAPSANMGSVEYGTSYPVNVSLLRGRLSPIFSQDNSSDDYWGRIKIQAWVKTTGSYSLVSTTAYIDFNVPVLTAFEMGGTQATGNYTGCLRPVYCDGTGTPIAVIEDGVKVFNYSVVSVANSWTGTDNGTYTDTDVQRTDVYFNVNILRNSLQAGKIDARLMATGSEITATSYGIANSIVFAPSETKNYAGMFKLGAPIVNSGFFTLEIQISTNNGTDWFTIGAIPDLAHDFE